LSQHFVKVVRAETLLVFFKTTTLPLWRNKLDTVLKENPNHICDTVSPSECEHYSGITQSVDWNPH